jgi:hypothetical protein
MEQKTEIGVTETPKTTGSKGGKQDISGEPWELFNSLHLSVSQPADL